MVGRLKFFEASENYHPLDYKFYKTRVVNLSEEYKSIHQSVSSAFFRFSIIKGKKFDEDVFSGEDTIFVNNLLLIKPIFGLIREVLYFYRRRADSSSTVQTQKFNINFYFKTIEQVEKYLIAIFQEIENHLFIKKLGNIFELIQYRQVYLGT